MYALAGHLLRVDRASNVKISQNTMSGVLLANGFVGLAETGSALQSLIDIVHICIIIVNISGLRPAEGNVPL